MLNEWYLPPFSSLQAIYWIVLNNQLVHQHSLATICREFPHIHPFQGISCYVNDCDHPIPVMKIRQSWNRERADHLQFGFTSQQGGAVKVGDDNDNDDDYDD